MKQIRNDRFKIIATKLKGDYYVLKKSWFGGRDWTLMFLCGDICYLLGTTRKLQKIIYLGKCIKRKISFLLAYPPELQLLNKEEVEAIRVKVKNALTFWELSK